MVTGIRETTVDCSRAQNEASYARVKLKLAQVFPCNGTVLVEIQVSVEVLEPPHFIASHKP